MKLTGRCLCEKVRYSISGVPIDAGFCHCKTCQRSSGAPAVAWLTVPVLDFRYTHGVVAIYNSSAGFQREFCSLCGTQIAFRATVSAVTVDVTLSSLEDSSVVKPEYHIWCQSKAPWLHINDELPQYADAGPDI